MPNNRKDGAWYFRTRGRNVSFRPPSQVHVDPGDAIVRTAVLGTGIAQVPHNMLR